MNERAALVERWYDLTRRLLPALAAGQRWPIHADHCFMRVCLDEAVGAPWPQLVKRPAIHNMTDAQLAAAVRVAETILQEPDTLPALNRRSLQRRRAGQA